MILFVTTDEKDICPVVGGVGRSTLNKWVARLANKKPYMVVDTDDTALYDRLEKNKNLQLIAVGDKAAKELDKMYLKYFKLPNPSPKNTFLKNRVQVDAVIEECAQWLKSRS